MKANYKTYNRQQLKNFCDKTARAEYEKISNEIYMDAVKTVIPQVMAYAIMELRLDFGFGKSRIQRFYNGVGSFMQELNANGITDEKWKKHMQVIQDMFDIDLSVQGVDFIRKK